MTDAKGSGKEHRKAVLQQERMNHSSARPPMSRVTSTSWKPREQFRRYILKTAERTTDLHRSKLSTTNSHTNPKNMDHVGTDAIAHNYFRQDKNWYSSHLVAMRDEVHLQQIRDTLLVI
jgi:hypothetical protein